MDYQKKVLEHYNIELTEDTYNSMADLSVYKNLTADGYEIWMINHEGGLDQDHNIDWDHDVFMYKDDISQVLFDQMKDRPFETWYIDEIEDIFHNSEWAEKWALIEEELEEE